MKLNGWQRIGVVASIAWIVGSFFYIRKQQMKFGLDYVKFHFDICVNEKHLAVSECLAQMDKELATAYQIGWEEIIFYGVLPVPLAWLIVYVGAQIFIWVRKGFV